MNRMPLNATLHQRASDRLEFGRGGFQVRRVLPGLCLQNANDPGFGPLGAFDHARLQPGVVVAMHQHRNDEIFSYVRRGTMRDGMAPFPECPSEESKNK